MNRVFTAIAAVPLCIQLAGGAGPAWRVFNTGVAARLRGVSVPRTDVVWASGTDGTVIRTTDGGETWTRFTVPGSEKLDFRDIDAIDDRTAYVLSIGPGEASCIYKTTDAGNTWTLQFRNEDPKAFFDAIAFRDARRGFAFSDSVDGQFIILRTENGGETWARIPAAALPPALAGEGAYAASGSNISIVDDTVWIGTSASRVLRSTDGGRSWTVAGTPMPSSNSAGIFSIAFRDALHGIAVGGDYQKQSDAIDNAAITTDGGRTWASVKGLAGFRSAVAFAPRQSRTVIAVGPTGTDVSRNDGQSWTAISGPGFHALAIAPKSASVWGVGEKGAVGRLDLSRFR